MRSATRAAVVVAVLPAVVHAGAIPVAGDRLVLRARGGARGAVVVLTDPAIAAPLPDPAGGAALVVSGGAAPGQCYAGLVFTSTRWRSIGGDGGRRGYRYRGAAGSPLRRARLVPGRLEVTVRGARWPCALTADRQRIPVTVTVRVGGTRYCAAFGGAVSRNAPRRFRAGGAPAPASCPDADVTVATLNVLHGLFCPPATARCRLADRLDLLFAWLAAHGCPDVVTLQEVSDAVAPLVMDRVAGACAYPHTAYVRLHGLDDEMILSRHPVGGVELIRLFGAFRTVLFARLDHPVGPLDVFSTHLASSSDSARNPCGDDCPPECRGAGAATVRDCQAVQLANAVAGRHDVPLPALITGDFNESPGSFVYRQLTQRGWSDSYVAAGNLECDPMTGAGCTSGRRDDDLSQLEDPARNQNERIDYVFVVPPAAGSPCTAILDGPADGDGDGTATRGFADAPNPFAPSCGPAPAPVCWPSDHGGVELDLACD